MTVWRPQQFVQVKALGLAWRDGRLLAGEVYSDDGSVKGVRPLGGAVEFGEWWRDALLREFREELGADVEIVGEPSILENIYSHHGMVGHEVVFAADVRFLSPVQGHAGRVEYLESDGSRCLAHWYDLDRLEGDGIELYPTGLMSVLRARGSMRG
jgi:8-oxo-dGTP pyrophosphatase MutT (NUDIX family)